jgi:hypothetical protein
VARQKLGMLPAHAHFLSLFGLPRSLLRTLNGAQLRSIFVLTRLDVLFNLVADCVP